MCINANGATPSAAECYELGMRLGNIVRTPLQGSLDLIPPMLDTIPREIGAMITLNAECAEVGSDWSGWEHACGLVANLAGRYPGRIKIVGCGNELDIYYNNGDGRMSPAFAAELVERASPILRPAGIRVAMSSVASGGWPDYLREMAARCWWAADYADLHLYVKALNGIPRNADMTFWQDANDAIALAKRRSPNTGLICSEAGIKVDDAGGLEEQAWWAMGLPDLQAELVCHFAWHDRVGSPGEQGGQAFGAVGLDGKRKPLWGALQAVFGGPISPSAPSTKPVFERGFAKWNQLHPGLLGKPKINETGVWEKQVAQATDKGSLFWNAGDLTFVTRGGRIWRWREDWLHDEEVAVR